MFKIERLFTLFCFTNILNYSTMPSFPCISHDPFVERKRTTRKKTGGVKDVKIDSLLDCVVSQLFKIILQYPPPLPLYS
jgi:hypothetical protein